MAKFTELATLVVNQLATIPGIAEVRAVPLGLLENSTPSTYPAAFATIDNPRRYKFEALGGHVTLGWKVTVGVMIYVNSAAIEGGQSHIALDLADQVLEAFLDFFPAFTDGHTAALAPCAPGDITQVIGGGAYIPLEFDIQMTK